MLNFIDQMDQMQKMITNTNHVLGKGLTQPMAALNSSIRKNMYATHQDQTLQIMEGEVALVSTGYENEYGRNSSAYVKNDEPFEVLARVEKFTNYIGHHYILLIRYLNSGMYDILERKTGEFIGENYGYIYDNKFIDSLNIGSVVKEDTTISKTISYDEYDNRTDGVNLIGVYMSDNDTTEDGIKVSESARNKLKSPLYHRVEVIVNDNDIMTDLYGAGTVYKPFPDIGEYVNNNLLTVLRRENKDEALFTLSYKRLKDILLSDEKFNVEGKVIDINISGNFNAPLEEVYYNAQLNYYINDGLRYSRDIVNLLGNYINEKCSYDLLYLYNYHKRIISGDKFIKDDKVFSNLIIKFDVLEINKLNVGDKITNRYGGKGVVSKIVPDWDMPVLPDGRRVEIILNSIGPVNRENPGQIIEISHNFITDQILSKGMCVLEDPQDFINILLEFYQIVSPNGLYPYYREALEKMNMIDKEYFVDTIMEYGIISALEPITEALDIDKIYELYERFKYVNQVHLDVPIRDSNGNTRFVPSRRPLVAAKIYMIRLKQYGKEKSSATSLSSTNIKNEPTKPKTNKFYKAPFAKTPIRFGEMEYGDMLHMMNIYAVVSDLLIVSASPMARRECISMYTENPFNVNVKLSPDAKNRNVEILNAYLKTMGLRLKFTKVKREKVVPFAFEAFKIIDGKEVKETLPIEPFIFSKDAIEPFEFEKPIEVFDFIDKNKSLVPFAFTVLEFIQKYIK